MPRSAHSPLRRFCTPPVTPSKHKEATMNATPSDAVVAADAFFFDNETMAVPATIIATWMYCLNE